MCSSTTRLPSVATWTETSACGSENDFASATPASASAASAAARSGASCSEARAHRRRGELPGQGRRGVRLEADGRHLAVGGVLDLEELALREAERAGEQDGREDLNRVVERQHGVVVDLARDRDLVLGVLQLRLEVEEVGARLQVRVRLGDGEEPAERLAQDALGGGRLRPAPARPRRAARAWVTASNVPRSWAA